MNLTIEYLKERHQYWSQKLFDLGIFKNTLKSITFEIKYGVKSYNGIFKYNLKNGVKSEKICIYPKVIDVNQQWLDNILVHEMIHQYIFDNKIKDTSSHGAYFKMLMNSINLYNIGVTISITDSTQKIEVKPYQIYKILVLKFRNNFFLCRIKSTKINYFTTLIISGRMCWKSPLISFGWYKTNHEFFANYQECTKRLHGACYPNHRLKELFEKYNLQKINVIEEL